MKKDYRIFLAVFLGALAVLAPPRAHGAIAADDNAAVIFVYQRIGEDSVPSSNISLEQFGEHVRELKAGGYNVLPLAEIVDTLRSGGAKTLPPRTVGITFDGAWLPTISNAAPILDAAKLPYTVFFASDLADANTPNYMNWDQLKSLRKNRNATLGILPAAYVHMADNDADTNAALVNRAVGRFREVFGKAPEFFVWPFGETSAALQRQVAAYDFSAAFGQQSGVAHADSNFLSLPRFIMTETYGDLDRFRLTANALPLPVTDIVPEDPLIAINPPLIGFTVTPEIKDTSRLACFVSDVGKVDLKRLGENRVEIRLDTPLPDRKTRVNCTLRSQAGKESWRWFGMILVTPAAERADTEEVFTEAAPEEP